MSRYQNMHLNLMAFGNVPVDPPEPPEPPKAPEPKTTYVEGPITRIRRGTSTLNDLEKAHKLIAHVIEIKKAKFEYLAQENALSIWFLSDVIGAIHLTLLGKGEEAGHYKKIKIEYQNSERETKTLIFSMDEINEEAFIAIQKLNDDCCEVIPK